MRLASRPLSSSRKPVLPSYSVFPPGLSLLSLHIEPDVLALPFYSPCGSYIHRPRVQCSCFRKKAVPLCNSPGAGWPAEVTLLCGAFWPYQLRRPPSIVKQCTWDQYDGRSRCVRPYSACREEASETRQPHRPALSEHQVSLRETELGRSANQAWRAEGRNRILWPSPAARLAALDGEDGSR